ncbi:MAG: SMP-30/gluconolactonase/LRE family protein [Parvularculaceae bacterium]
MRFIGGLVALAVIIVGGWFAYNIIPASGVFTRLKPQLVNECRRVDIFPGTEDVTIDPSTQTAFISADDRRATFAGAPVDGGIYTLSLDGSDKVVKVSPENFTDFHPHGISLFLPGDGAKRLFVINHTEEDGDRVEIFDVGYANNLIHVESVAFPAMSSPNDIVAVGPRSFYVTNDRGYKTGLMSTLEAWLALPFSSLAYYDGQHGRIAAKHLTYANGVNTSMDGATVYVSEFLRRRVDLFSRDYKTGALTKIKSFPTGAGPDNIEVDKDGALWIAGHPKVFSFLRHARDASIPSPSVVMKIDPETGKRKKVFVDTQGTLNASSVGAVWDDQLVVGSVFDDHVMVCALK